MEEQHVYSVNANVSAKRLREARWADISGNMNDNYNNCVMIIV